MSPHEDKLIIDREAENVAVLWEFEQIWRRGLGRPTETRSRRIRRRIDDGPIR